MPVISDKNYAASPAASDLGLGDALTQQLQDAEDERKKRLAAQKTPLDTGLSQMGLAAQSLFGGIGGIGGG